MFHWDLIRRHNSLIQSRRNWGIKISFEKNDNSSVDIIFLSVIVSGNAVSYSYIHGKEKGMLVHRPGLRCAKKAWMHPVMEPSYSLSRCQLKAKVLKVAAASKTPLWWHYSDCRPAGFTVEEQGTPWWSVFMFTLTGFGIPMETSLGISMKLFPECLTGQRRPILSVGKAMYPMGSDPRGNKKDA